MDQIDWAWVLATMTWTTGLATIVSIFGMANWRSSIERTSLFHILFGRKNLLALSVGGVIFIFGVFFTDTSLYIKAILVFVIVWLAIETILAWSIKTN